MNNVHYLAKDLVIVANVPETATLSNITVVVVVVAIAVFNVVGLILVIPGDIFLVDVAVTVIAGSSVAGAAGEALNTVVVVAVVVPEHASATVNAADAGTIHALVFMEDAADRVGEGGFCRRRMG